jgi:hypothetical protein
MITDFLSTKESYNQIEAITLSLQPSHPKQQAIKAPSAVAGFSARP